MAKSKSFFGLRRGSTKSHTYQVFRGLQVTKDRVYDVKNPQSTAQMEQRLKLPMVANYVASLKDILNHSFEGVEYGEESLKYARQINLRKGALSIVSYVPKGMMNAGLADFVVSKGTLAGFGDGNGVYFDSNEGSFGFKSAQVVDFSSFDESDDGNGRALTAADLALLKTMMFPADSDADQITILLVHAGNDYQWKDSNNQDKLEPYNRYAVGRLVFDTDRLSENSGWRLFGGSGGHYIWNGFIRINLYTSSGKPTTVPAGTFHQVGYTDSATSAADNPLMAASIVSKNSNGTWKRSSAVFEVLPTVTAVTYNDVVNTYLNASSTTESTKYLNAGSSAVDIPGGDTAA